MPKPKEAPLRSVVQKKGTTKVVACDSADTGFDYLIFSDSKPLLQSIEGAVSSAGDPRFSAAFQTPKMNETSKYAVGVRVQDPAPCETLRHVLESRPEIRCIEHDALLNLVKTLYAQMYALEASHGRAVPYFSLDDIIVISDAMALFINDDKLFEVTPSGTIDVTRAIGREDGSFYPPELSGSGKLASLPYTVSSRCAYYSFGMLVAYCATLNPALALRKVALKKEGVLAPIQGTKLYWFILRCCASNPARRFMLYV